MTDESLQDPTNRRRSEGPASRESFVWSLLDAAPDGIVVVDVDGRIRMVNEQIEDLFGYRRRELIDAFVDVLVPDGLQSDHEAHRAAYAAEPQIRAMGEGRDLRARRADGSEFPVEVSLSPVRSGGELYVIAVVRDINERVERDRRLHESERALADMERALAVADDRERIARDLHDTVIQRIFAAGLTLQGLAGRLDDASRQRLDGIVGDLDETIHELRRSIFSLQNVDRSLSGLRGRILRVVNEEGAALGFEPRLQFDGAVETITDDVAEQLVAVVREALSNVVRHATAHRVRVAVTVGDEIVVAVEDDGVGIPGQVVGGRGIENMSRRAHALGGTCSLRNTEPRGARLEWRVPSARPGDPPGSSPH